MNKIKKFKVPTLIKSFKSKVNTKIIQTEIIITKNIIEINNKDNNNNNNNNKNPCTYPIEENKLYLNNKPKRGFTGATGPTGSSNFIDSNNIPTNSILFKDVNGNINGANNLIFDPSDVGGLGKITFPGVLDPLAVVFSPTPSNPVVGPNAPYTLWVNSNTNNFMINESQIITTSDFGFTGPTGQNGPLGPTGQNGFTGPTGPNGVTGPVGPTGSSIGGSSGDIITITDNLQTINLLTSVTNINNFTQSGLSISLEIPTTSIIKTIKLSSGSFSTNINTGFGTFILNSGETVSLVFVNSQWNIISNDGIVVPQIQQGQKIVATGNIGSSQQGFRVALSSDATTLAIGGNLDNSGIGAIWIFVRDNNGVYVQQGNKIVGSGNIGNSQQGSSISLSNDGNTLAFGGPIDNSNIGAVWIFTRSNGIWTQQGNKLVGSGGINLQQQGFSVALSSDGNTLVTGGPIDNTLEGAVWIFTRSNGVWTQQGNKLVGSGSIKNLAVRQGTSVAISSDGNTIAFGGRSDTTGGFQGVGATWVFTRSNGVWTQQGNKLVGNGFIEVSQQGSAVSLSSDGNTLAIGGRGDNTNIGATWIFTRSNGIWTQQGSKLIGSGSIGQSQQGSGISLSSDGNTLAIGGRGDNTNVGATWIFTRSNGVWTQQGNKLVGSGNIGQSQQGECVFLSDDGSILAVGGPFDNTQTGATWIFA